MSALVKPAPRPVTLRHHTSALTTVDFATLASTECLVSGDVAGEVALWNVATRRVVAAWRPHAGAAVLKVEALHGGGGGGSNSGRLLTQGRDGVLCVWDASRVDAKPRRAAGGAQSNAAPEPLATLYTGSYNFCQCATVRWVHGGDAAAGRSSDSSAKVDAQEPDQVSNGAFAQSEEGGVEGSGIGRLLARSDARGEANKNEGGPSCAFSVDNDSRSDDDANEESDLAAAGTIGSSDASSASTSTSSGSSSGGGGADWVATPCGETSAVQLWDLRDTRKPALTVAPSATTPKTGMLMCLDLVRHGYTNCIGGGSSSSSDDLVCIAGYESGHVLVYDLRTGAQVGLQQPHEEPVLSVVAGPARSRAPGRRAVTPGDRADGSGDCTGIGDGVDAERGGGSGAWLQVVSAAADAALAVCALALSGGSHNVLGAASARLPLGADDKHPGAEALALSQHLASENGAMLACGGWDRRVRLFEWHWPHRPLGVLKQHTAAVAALAWSPDGRLLASAGRDGNVALWAL